MKIVEVSQFFPFGEIDWSELLKVKEKGVIPDVDGETFLFAEKPLIRLVKMGDNPKIGMVWLKKGKNNKVMIYKYNYDTSD